VNREEHSESAAAPEQVGEQSVPAPMSSVGEILAQARIEKGLSVEDIARQLRFGMRQIQALEAGRLDQLPGVTFVRGIVRSYARLLKLDPAPLIEQLEGKFDAPDANSLANLFRQPVPFSDGAKRSNLIYGIVTLAVLAIAGVLARQWYFDKGVRQSGAAPAARAPAPMEPSNPSATVPAAPAVTPQVPTAPTPVAASPTSAPPVSGPAAQEPPSAAAAAAATPAVARGQRQIELRFEEESWVEVTNGSGQILTSQLNLPGSRRVLEGTPPLTVVIGNAQHVRILVNGKPIDLRPHIRVEVARLVLE